MLTEKELELLNSDGKFRSYTNGIDKALKNFEYSSEWPDLISALGKLSKVIQSNARFKTIPKSLVVSKRLAQCLHPSLPSGVHIYDLVFKCIHGDKDKIFTFSSGMFPLLSYAGMAVKPLILRIYEDHFLPLDNQLVDALDGFLPALLCGMEEGSDVYIRATTLLTSIKTRVTDLMFYTKLWDSMTLSVCRLPAINYMLQDNYIPEEPSNILSQLLECLSDVNILTQRSALELINTWNMDDWDVSVRVEVLAGAMGTLLRRDVSLNRRFYNMVIAEDDKMDHALIESTRKILSTHNDKFRIIMMLFDKPEICTKIMEPILIDVIRTLHLTQEKDSLLMLMCNLEPAYIITYLSKQDLNPDICKLISFIHNYIAGDFTPLLLKLVEPQVHKLELAIEILNGKPSCDMEIIRSKMTSLYIKIAPCNEQLFSDYTTKGFNFDDIITNIISDDDCVESMRTEIEVEAQSDGHSQVGDGEPLTCYYSLSESLAIDSVEEAGEALYASMCLSKKPCDHSRTVVDSCVDHFGLNDFNSNSCYEVMGYDEKLPEVVEEQSAIKNACGEKSKSSPSSPSKDTTYKVDLLSEKENVNHNNNNTLVMVSGDDEKMNMQTDVAALNPCDPSTECMLESIEQLSNNSVVITLASSSNDDLSVPPPVPPLIDDEESLDVELTPLTEKCDSRSNSTEIFDSMNESSTSTLINSPVNLGNDSFKLNKTVNESSTTTSLSPTPTPNYKDLLSILHQTLPPLMKQPYDTIPCWLQTLLSNCIDTTSSSAMESLLTILDNDTEIIPKTKLRKLQIVNNIVNHLWDKGDAKSHAQLSRFLYHFPETESNIVIKLNHSNEIIQFQDFIINNNTIVDSCILKLIDNLKSNDQLLSHCSYELLNRLVKQSVSIVLDPIIINLLDKSTRRHYIDVKSNSTPDLTKLHATNKVLNRSTGNLSTIDSPEVNVLVYNSMYDTRRIKFILEKLQSLLCFQNFIVNTARVHVSDSIRWRLLSKLIQQQCNEVNGVTYIHVLIQCLVNFSTCLYSTGTAEDVNSNIDVQVTSIAVLNEYCSRLVPLSTTNQLTHQSSSFTCYIDSVMKSTKLVKRILMSLLSIVNLNNSMTEHTKLLQFNFADDSYRFIVQVGLIKLLTTLIELESKVMLQQTKSSEDLDLKQETGKYISGYALQEQPLFKHLILHGLRNCTYHWEDLLRKSIVYFGNGLWNFVQGVVGVLCDNIMSRSSIEVNLETLTSILHYVILDTDVDSTKSHQPTTESTIYSLLTSWLPQSGSHASANGNANVVGSSNEMSPKHLAKVNLLNEFGRVLNTLGFVWLQESNLRSKVIQLLNPIALTHMDDFVRSTADVVPVTDNLVDIILHLNVIRLANLTSSTITVISNGKTSRCINMLQLYSQYIGSIGSALSQDLPMPLLIQLLRESANLPSEGQNLLLLILNRVMCTFGLPPSITRQEVKELQECTQKLLEFISSNASPLELNKKRNSGANINECLSCLSNNLPGLLDIVWGSEDKDKLLPVLSHVIYLVFPHLKSKTSPTFEPATILFVNLTKFTHLKKAWKKEIFDHLIDPSFFRMSLEDFKNWLVILDNVFSQDKGSFSELIARATVPTSNTLNIFTSKETEYENRAMLLKRLAVVIYSSSNMDEYVRFITSIQERISESLKAASPNVIPNIQLSVFLLFRVLLVKLSVNHLTSLWPIICHEVSVVLSLLEQDLISSMNNIITADGRMEKPWTCVYSSVFKLLQEASKLPLFRMYSWNFTNNIIPRLKQHSNDLITAFEKTEERSSIEEDFIEL